MNNCKEKLDVFVNGIFENVSGGINALNPFD
ncbi:hypothetical protein SMU44_08594 [Streptococcus mutans 11VS1]|jgi:hypothetical protein|nr:hypothetical protein SMU44_08594 [Streptococcus mutans 11VS1]EMC19500.1 hypothetical protein SMU80_09565 [Streptococcus mutans SF1]